MGIRPSRKYKILYTQEAKKRIEKLDTAIRQTIRRAVESLSRNPYLGKPLTHELSGLYSWRTSDYRIIYRIKEYELVIIIITIGHRRDVYKKLKRLLG